MLNEQIEQLKALRNAKTRDTEFKQWRQTTLTIVQRIWPGDGKRSARFRRVPFSPPSTRADARETREFYERGCAEAIQLLMSFVEDVERDGVPDESAASRPASLDPGVAEDHFPTLDLPGGPERTAEAPALEPVAEREAARAAPKKADTAKKKRRKGARGKLRDMLGLDALQRLGNHEADSATVPAEPVAAEPAVDPEPDAEAPWAARVEEDAAPAPIPTLSADAVEADEAVAGDVDEDGAEEASDGDADAPGLSADDFLSASPVFMASGQPVRRVGRDARQPEERPAPPAGPRSITGPTAMAIAAVAAEVARLGVPDRRRADVRGTLIALAETLEDGSLDWNTLRATIQFSMEFPAVARRVIPLLIPFLDEAA